MFNIYDMRKNKTLPQTIMHCRRHKSWGNGHVRARCMDGSPFSGASSQFKLQNCFKATLALCIPIFLSGETNANPAIRTNQILAQNSLAIIIISNRDVFARYFLLFFFHMSIVSSSMSNHHHHDCICSIGKNATLSCEFDQDPLFCAFINPDGNYTITITESLL